MNDEIRRILDQETPAEQEARADNLILTFMLDEPYPWTVEEIGREFRDPGYASDAVGRLASAGLVIASASSCSQHARRVAPQNCKSGRTDVVMASDTGSSGGGSGEPPRTWAERQREMYWLRTVEGLTLGEIGALSASVLSGCVSSSTAMSATRSARYRTPVSSAGPPRRSGGKPRWRALRNMRSSCLSRGAKAPIPSSSRESSVCAWAASGRRSRKSPGRMTAWPVARRFVSRCHHRAMKSRHLDAPRRGTSA